MYKVTKRDCPMFGIGPYVCEFICDTASDIATLPTSISEGTGGRTAYDNQKCASGSIANVAENGAESKQYMLNNQDIWCPYSVASGSSEHQDLSEYAKKTEVPSIKVNSAVNADTVNGHTVNADVPADAKFTDTVPDLSLYALKSKYGDTTIDVGRKADTVIGAYSTAEGRNATASGTYSHAEGNTTTASNAYCHAEGYRTTASGESSHAEGYNTTASEQYSHAEGCRTTASGESSHAEGYSTTASGSYSHTEGLNTTASGFASHAGGTGTKALHDNEVAYGKYNESKDDTVFSIGDGTADDARHNAFEITKTGGILHDKNIATADLIPTELPANGGNADTVDGLHANDFIKVNSSDAYDCNTLYDAGLYLCNGSATNTPNNLVYGTLLVMPYRKPYGNAGMDYCAQIFIPNGDVDDTSMWYRTSLQNTWNEWKRSCDGGNADTVGGKLPGKIFYDNGMSSDLNSATKSGCYGASPDTLNTPLSTWWLVDTMNYNDQFIVQKAYIIGDATRTPMYVRNYANNAWSNWSEISTTAISTT